MSEEVYSFDEESMARLIRAVRIVEGWSLPSPPPPPAPPGRGALPIGFFAVAVAEISGRKWTATELILDASLGTFAPPAYGGRVAFPIIIPGPKPKAGDLLRVDMVGGGRGKQPAYIGTALQEVILDNMANPAAATKMIRRRHTPASYVDDTLFEFPQCPT